MQLFLFITFFYIILVSVIGYGILLKKIISSNNKIIFVVPDQYLGFYGLALVTFISMFTNIFVPHNFIYNTILHLSGFLLACYFFYYEKKFKYLKHIFYISLALLSLLFISKPNEDFPYYHLPYVVYLTENKLIFGIGHLNHGFNLLSSLFNFNSTTRLPYIGVYSFHYVYVYFLIFFNFFILREIFSKNKDIVIITLFVLSGVFFNLSFNRIAEFGTDKPGQLLMTLIAIKLLEYLKNINNSQDFDILPILPMFAYVISLKAYFITWIVLLLPIFFFKLNLFNFINKILFTRSFVFCLCLVILMCVHYFFATGCLIAPISELCFANTFYWARSIDDINGLSFWLEQWAKSAAGPGFRVEDPLEFIKGFNWVSNWIDRYFFIKVTDQLGILFISIILVYGFIFKPLKNNNFSINSKIYFFYGCLITIFFVWFLKHPSLRYGGYPVVFLVIILPLVLYFSNFKTRKNFLRKIKILMFLIFFILNIKNISRINNEINRNDMYKFTNFPHYTIKKLEYISRTSKSGLIVYSPKPVANGWNYCWDIPAPCVMSSQSIVLSEFKNGYFFIKKPISE